MSFYTSIASHYDDIFPDRTERHDFVRSYLGRPACKILDIGCATGGLANTLAGLGHEVVGVDLDGEMIGMARQRAKAQGLTSTFLVEDMTAIDRCVAARSLDLVMCFGNTLVHLRDGRAIGQVCSTVKAVLAPEGRFIGQIVNYDRVMDRGLTSLPTIENDAIRFERRYDFGVEKERVLFATSLTVKATGTVIDNEIFLYPMRRGELETCLRNAGFATVDYFGGYDARPWSNDGGPTFFVAGGHR